MVVRSKHLLLSLVLAVHLGLNSLYLWPLVLVVVLLSAKKSPKLTLLNQRRFCNSTIDPDAGDAVLGCKVLTWLIYHNMTRCEVHRVAMFYVHK